MQRTMRFLVCITFYLISISSCALARDGAGRINFIRYPVSTRPEFVQSGATLTVDVSETMYKSCGCSFHLFLDVNGVRMELSPVSYVAQPATDTMRFSVPVPSGMKPGLYGLAAHKGPHDDMSEHAVAVVDKFPETYSIVHITDIHMGRVKDDLPVAATAFDLMKLRLNALKPAMIIITGDVTEKGLPEQFKAFVDALDGVDAPVFAVGGDHDNRASESVAFLGSGQFDFNFGPHYFLAFDTQDEIESPGAAAQMEWIKNRMSANAGAPFKVMFSHRFGPNKQRIISDAPAQAKVNLLLLGDRHIDLVERIGKPPALAITTPAELDGYYRVINVKANRVADFKVYNLKTASKKQ